MFARDVFRVEPAPIVYVDPEFLKYFGDLEVITDATPLQHRELKRMMADAEITKKWQPEAITIGALSHALKYNQDLLRNGNANIFRMKDAKGVLRAVDVLWFVGGWRVGAYPVDGPDPWSDGCRVFSRKFW